jgi:hypothetical protein
MVIDIDGLDRVLIFQALFNSARIGGVREISERFTAMFGKGADMTYDEAKKFLSNWGYYTFDYVKGRVLKFDADSNGLLRFDLYDRDNGEGCAQAAFKAYGLPWKPLQR